MRFLRHPLGSRRLAAASIAGLLAAAALAGCGASGSSSGFAGDVIDPPFTLPAGSFIDTAGATYDLAHQATGHVTVVYFGYTHCPDICPTTMADLGIALRSLPAKTADDIQVVFVTSDPRRDTPSVIGTWLAHFDTGLAHPFIGLATSQSMVDAYGEKLGIALSPPTINKDGSEDVVHGAEALAFSPDDEAHLVWSPGTTPKQYAADLTKLVAGKT
jgi:protein SCO1/2